ncbi:MAG TPA: cell filamentation protein Fic [Gallionella sp.]|nr:MAG: cell filamentation protein Fic [Gallionellales bacterium GWA2_54_124]OGT29100.1 MAG: cell filamentation protein Fic [Gallionellales bacterium RIFOXYD2_FULL_52_7]HCI53305.1 cell filamentation protein Fic [Gallionella sp.]
MSTPNEKLAESLKLLKIEQDRGLHVFQSKDFSRVHRDRLVAAGFMKEVIKGWYIISNPAEKTGESTAWYASFHEFVTGYCNVRFGNDWYLSPEASLQRHAGNTTIPRQLMIHTKTGSNNNLTLKFETGLFDYRSKDFASGADIVVKDGIRLLSLPASLVRVSPTFFATNPIDAQIALSQIADASEILVKLLEGGNSVVAGRIAGAMRAMGRANESERIVRTMRDAGYAVTESDPFQVPLALLPTLARAESACAIRIRLIWESMREEVIRSFPPSPGVPDDVASYIADVDDRHIEDAYHSLSIEGYRVTEVLIAKIASGKWNPEENSDDKNDRNALAAKGYHQAFVEVRKSLSGILERSEPGEVIRRDHHDWYRKLFEPSVMSGILEAKHLAGYRSWPVFIRYARHVPPSYESVRDAMPVFFDLISKEPEAAVRAVLGHFIFVYIHPYGDGNGRMARFLMNAMLASGGYPWTVIHVEDRDGYMAALEQASVNGNIKPFADFISTAVQRQVDKVSAVSPFRP